MPTRRTVSGCVGVALSRTPIIPKKAVIDMVGERLIKEYVMTAVAIIL
jgi:hypothetical protein